MGTMAEISRHLPPCINIVGVKFAHQRSSGIASAAAVHYLKIPLRQPDLSQNVIQFAWRQGWPAFSIADRRRHIAGIYLQKIIASVFGKNIVMHIPGNLASDVARRIVTVKVIRTDNFPVQIPVMEHTRINNPDFYLLQSFV